MGKKSRKCPIRTKDNAGCMPSLISMFDFRQGRFTQRLLSNRPIDSRDEGTVLSRNSIDVHNLEEKQENNNDIDAKAVGNVSSGRASIKELMEEEMSRAHNSMNISRFRVDQLRAELGFGSTPEKNRKTTDKVHKVGSDCYSSDSMASPSTCSVPSESSSSNANLAEFMVDFCGENHQREEKHIECVGYKNNNSNNSLSIPDPWLIEKYHVLKNALGDIREARLSEKSTESEHISIQGAVQPKEFMHALETLTSNKELFLKLLQDPDSLLFQQVLDLQNDWSTELEDGSTPKELVNCQPSHKQGRHNFFRKKDKSEPANSTSKKIVVLKPTPARHQEYLNTISPISSPKFSHNLQHPESTERVSSHFSLKEIKRRLRNAIGHSKKHRHLIAMDGVLHKVPYGFKNEDENNKTSTTGQTTTHSKFLKRGTVNPNSKEQFQKETVSPTTAHRSHRESIFYEEARKRLVEMFSAGSQNEISPRHASKQLCRIISVPGYNSLSPLLSPAREKDIDSPRLSRVSSLHKINQDDSTTINNHATQSIHSLSCSESKSDEGLQLFSKNSTLLETQLDLEEDSVIIGSSRTGESESSDVSVELSMNEFDCISEKCKQGESCSSSDSEQLRHESSPVQKLQSPEIIAENPDHPSPVSVLEPFFSEINESTETDQAKMRKEPQPLVFEEHVNSPLVLTSTVSESNQRSCIEDNETKLKYVRTVLEASGLIYNPFQNVSQLSDQLLDPFVYDEVEILYEQMGQDSKLLFDCINEVLVEMQKRYLNSNPWIAFIRPSILPIPTGEKFVQEVCKRVDWHLSTQFPFTLDQLARKDLDAGTWMDARLETEGAVFEIGEVILEYIMEETILELWE